MGRILSSILIAAALASAAQLPRKAPEFVIQNPGGKQVLLSSYRGKAVVFAMMFTTCEHCQKMARLLARIQTEYAGRDVQVLGTTFDKDAPFNIQNFNRMFGVNFPCGYSSSKSVNEFIQQPPDSPPFVPILVFIDKTGTIRSQYVGDEKFLSNPEVNVRAEIEKLLKPGARRNAKS